jgi:hypothetical protein
MSETKPRKRRPYEPPKMTEIVLDSSEVMLTHCRPGVVTSPPCPKFNHSVLPEK